MLVASLDDKTEISVGSSVELRMCLRMLVRSRGISRQIHPLVASPVYRNTGDAVVVATNFVRCVVGRNTWSIS